MIKEAKDIKQLTKQEYEYVKSKTTLYFADGEYNVYISILNNENILYENLMQKLNIDIYERLKKDVLKEYEDW